MDDLEKITNNEAKELKSKKQNLIRSFYNWSSNYVNYKMGSVGGIISGSVVYYINSEHGFWPAIGSFGKQFLYSLFIAGFNIKTCEKFAKRIKPKLMSLVTSTLVPTAQAFAINYSIHKFGGTPEAFDSSIWQVYANLPLFFSFALAYRKKLNR